MSYNGTVRCGWCYQKGHNKRSCPQRRKRAEERAEAGDDYMLRQMNNKKKVTCGWCGEQGHNARTCPVKKQAQAELPELKRLLEKFALQTWGAKVGRGTMVKRAHWDGGNIYLATELISNYTVGFSSSLWRWLEKKGDNERYSLITYCQSVLDSFYLNGVQPTGEKKWVNVPHTNFDILDNTIGCGYTFIEAGPTTGVPCPVNINFSLTKGTTPEEVALHKKGLKIITGECVK